MCGSEAGHVSDEEALAVVVDLVGAFEFVEDGTDGLAGCGGEAADVLVGEEGTQEGLVTDFAALLAGGLFEEVDDALAGILEGEGFDALLGTTEFLGDLLHDAEGEFGQFTEDAGGVFAHDLEHYCGFVHGGGAVVAGAFTKHGTFAKDLTCMDEVFEDFLALFAMCKELDAAALDDVDPVGGGVALVEEAVAVEELLLGDAEHLPKVVFGEGFEQVDVGNVPSGCKRFHFSSVDVPK